MSAMETKKIQGGLKLRKLKLHAFILIPMLSLIPMISFAKTGYVSDTLLLTFRQGPGNDFNIIKTLRSNTPVSILDEENGFYKVKLQSKEIGWVNKKFIIFELPKTYIIAKLTQKNKALEDKIDHFKSKLDRLKKSLSSQENKYANRLIDLEKRLKKVTRQNSAITHEVNVLKSENRDLFKTGMIKWALFGTGTLLLGWIIGRSVSSEKRRESTSLN